MDLDEYGTVINGDSTSKAISSYLAKTGQIFIAWTDEQGTQVDIFFALGPRIEGPVQSGLHNARLFIGVARFGFFGFDVNSRPCSSGYIAEKLTLGDTRNTTSDKMAELINSVKMCLLEGEL